MSLSVDFNAGWDPQIKRKVEEAIRNCIGKPPRGEQWTVSVDAGFSQNFCDVQVVTPRQRRARMFLEEPAKLPKAIANWIKMYPLS